MTTIARKTRFRKRAGVREKVTIDDFDDLQGVYDAFQDDFDAVDHSEMLTEFIEELAWQHQRMFTKQQDSSGKAWPPLSPAYAKWKGHSRILFLTGELAASLQGSGTADSIREVFREEGVGITGLIYGTRDEKAGFHQFGTFFTAGRSGGSIGFMPPRPPVGITEELVNELTENTADETVRQLTAT